jgi:hypothetical protein
LRLHTKFEGCVWSDHICIVSLSDDPPLTQSHLSSMPMFVFVVMMSSVSSVGLRRI